MLFFLLSIYVVRCGAEYKGSGAIYMKRNQQGDKVSLGTLNKLTKLQCVHACIKNKRCSSFIFDKKDIHLGDCVLQEKNENIQTSIFQIEHSLQNYEIFESFSLIYSSCQEGYENGNRLSGNYFLSNELNWHFCNMGELKNCGVGGWTLAMTIDGKKPTFAWDSPYWLNDAIYNVEKGFLSPFLEEAKYPAFSYLEFSEICLGMKSGTSETSYMKIARSNKNTLKRIFNDKFTSIENGRESWLKLLNGSKLQPDCSGTNNEGFNIQGKAANLRLGITCYDDNPEWSDSWVGLGGQDLFCLETESMQAQSSAGNQCCSNECNEFSLKAMAYLFIK
ncbi:uncharacterized protein LOC101239289 [Hydra vulgaris]|uniref:uncharacterized protein LOC101239289 n=1 Tax=Hydra vulgaris TaxID=6087 RepID=UPI0006411D83|nr:uncharacterized protein LOC101239289 [Hydra vulgaris]